MSQKTILAAPFVMDPDVYDAIDLVAISVNGLRRNAPYVFEGEKEVCGCMLGAAHFAGVYGSIDDKDPFEAAYRGWEANKSLTPSPIDFDRAHRVLAPNDYAARIPWKQVAEVLGVVRGAE